MFLRPLLACHAGFTFPNCLGNLTLTVSGGAGAPPPTGNVTLIVAGGHKNATLGSVRPSGLQGVPVHAAHVSCNPTPAENMSAHMESTSPFMSPLRGRCMPQTSGSPAAATLSKVYASIA